MSTSTPGYITIPGTGPNGSSTNYNIISQGGFNGISDLGSFVPIIPGNDVTVNPLYQQYQNTYTTSDSGNSYWVNAQGQEVQNAPAEYLPAQGGNPIDVQAANYLNAPDITNNSNGSQTDIGYSLVNGQYVPTGQQGEGSPNQGFLNRYGAPLVQAGVGLALGNAAGIAAGGGIAGNLATAATSQGLNYIENSGGSGMSVSSPNNGAILGMGSATSSPFGPGSSTIGSLASLYNTYQGNQANQQLGNNLMGMYTNAQQQAAPSVQATNNLIQNPNSYFSSPLYQSQANLYGQNVNANLNASGQAGNGIQYTKDMMGFAGQNYDNYLNTVGNQAQGFLGNQAKYGQDYAYGTALANQSNAAANGNYVNAGANLLSSLTGGSNGGLSSLFGNSSTGGASPYTAQGTDLAAYANNVDAGQLQAATQFNPGSIADVTDTSWLNNLTF